MLVNGAVLLFAAALADVTGFRIVDTVDPMNDLHKVYAIVGTSEKYLAVGCEAGDKNLQIVVHFPSFLGSDSVRAVSYRFDSLAAISAAWDSRGDVVGNTFQPVVSDFVKALRSSRKIAFRAYDFREQPHDIVFEFADPASTLDDMKARCAQ